MRREVTVEADGSLRVPAEVCEAMAWPAGAGVVLESGAGEIALRPAPDVSREDAAPVKERAREHAAEMHAIGQAAVPPTEGDPQAGRAPHLAFEGHTPSVPASCYVSPAATLIGDVVLGEECSVWPGAVLRGDVNRIRVGARTNIQDGAVVHVHHGEGSCRIGQSVTVGHQAVVHACEVADHVLVGIHAVVLDGARIGERCLIGAGSVVTPGTVVPPGKLVLGVPAKVARDLTAAESESILWHADHYVSLREQYLRPPPAADAPRPPHHVQEPPQRGERPRYLCRRVREPITIDGALTESAWGAVPPLPPLQLATGAGAPVMATEVKACWDDRHLYVAFSCHDSDIWGTYEERDAPLYDEEVVEVFLCPTGDLAHYFEFEVSPRNTLFDARVFGPTLDRRAMIVDRGWDAPGIRTAVGVAGTLDRRDDVDLGWIAELAIPFADLGLPGPPIPGTVWRANFYRIERGEVEEFTAWSPTYREPADFHVPQCFGELVFEENGVVE